MGDENLYQSFNTQSKSGQKVEDRSEFAIRSAQAGWDEAVRHSPLNRLRLLDARLARPDVDIEQVKTRAAELVRDRCRTSVERSRLRWADTSAFW